MLKEVISSILITALLIQTFGCTSSKEITINDLRHLNSNKEIKVVTKDLKEYLLQNQPESVNTNSWKADEDYIYIYSTRPKKFGNDQIKLVTDTVKIPLSSIENIDTDSFDIGLTILCILGITLILGIVFFIVLSIGLGNAINDSFK